MLKRNKQTKRPRDVNQWARQMVEESARENGAPLLTATEAKEITVPPTAAQISIFMAEMGREGGKIGGKRRLETMTAKERSRVAKRAAEARWKLYSKV